MDKPLCRLCGVRHYGGCPSLLESKPHLVKGKKVVKRRVSAKGHEHVEGLAPGTKFYALETKTVDPLDHPPIKEVKPSRPKIPGLRSSSVLNDPFVRGAKRPLPERLDPFGQDPYGFVDAPGAKVAPPVEPPEAEILANKLARLTTEHGTDSVTDPVTDVTKPVTNVTPSVTKRAKEERSRPFNHKVKHCPTCTCQRVHASKAEKQKAYRERKATTNDDNL